MVWSSCFLALRALGASICRATVGVGLQRLRVLSTQELRSVWTDGLASTREDQNPCGHVWRQLDAVVFAVERLALASESISLRTEATIFAAIAGVCRWLKFSVGTSQQVMPSTEVHRLHMGSSDALAG